MPGFTKAQLRDAGEDLSGYIWCRNCRLYWRKRGRRTHRHPSARPRKPSKRKAPELSPAMKEFLDYLVDEAVVWWLAQAHNEERP